MHDKRKFYKQQKLHLTSIFRLLDLKDSFSSLTRKLVKESVVTGWR